MTISIRAFAITILRQKEYKHNTRVPTAPTSLSTQHAPTPIIYKQKKRRREKKPKIIIPTT